VNAPLVQAVFCEDRAKRRSALAGRWLGIAMATEDERRFATSRNENARSFENSSCEFVHRCIECRAERLAVRMRFERIALPIAFIVRERRAHADALTAFLNRKVPFAHTK
jgi:hypothetical protein